MALVCTLLLSATAAGCLLPAVEARWAATLALVSPLASTASRPELDLQRELQEAALNSAEMLNSSKTRACDEVEKKIAAGTGTLDDLLFLDQCAPGGRGFIEGSCDSMCLICNNPDKGGFYIRRSHSAIETGIAIAAGVGATVLGGGVGLAVAGAVAGAAAVANSAIKDHHAQKQQADLVSALFDVPKSCKGTMIYPYNKEGAFDGPPISLQSWAELKATLASRPGTTALQLPQLPEEAWANALLLTRFWGHKHGLLAAEKKFAPNMDSADPDVYENARWNELETPGKVLPARLIDSLGDILCDGTGIFSVDVDKSSAFNSATSGFGRTLSSGLRLFSSAEKKWESMQKDGVFKAQAEDSGYGAKCHLQVAKANGGGVDAPDQQTRLRRQEAASKSKGHEGMEALKAKEAEMAQQPQEHTDSGSPVEEDDLETPPEASRVPVDDLAASPDDAI